MLGKLFLVLFGVVLALVAQLILSCPSTAVSFSDGSLPAAQLPPWPVWRVISSLTAAAIGFLEGAPAPVRMMNRMTAFWQSELMSVFGQLDVGTRVFEAPGSRLTCEALAASLSQADGREADAQHVCTLSAAWVALDFLEQDAATGELSLTELGDLMRPAHPYSFHGFVRSIVFPDGVASWHELGESIFTRKSGMKQATDEEIWEYFASHDLMEAFGTGMTALTVSTMPPLLADFDMSGVKTFCDVGGGQGTALAVALAHYPEMRGMVFDMPAMQGPAEAFLKEEGVSARASFVGGDFFEPFPEQMQQCDVFMIRNILHDWSDADGERILSTIAGSMRPGAQLLVNDMVLGSTGYPHLEMVKTFMSVNMFASCPFGARERSADDFARMFANAGLKVVESRELRDVYGVTVGELA